MRRVLLTLIVTGLLLVMVAAPALAFHHRFVPGGPCGESPNSGGKTPAVAEHNPVQGGDELPLPPTGTPAADNAGPITEPATCPAPQKTQ